MLELTDEDVACKERALELLRQDRMELLQVRPFIGILAMSLKLVPVVDARCVTASTDGRRIFFNAHWACAMPSEHRVTILAHEIWHCGLLHFTRERGRLEHHEEWNFAIDHEVNSLLKGDGFEFGGGEVYYPEHEGKSAEQIFDLLIEGKLECRGEILDDHPTGPPKDTVCEGSDDPSNPYAVSDGILWCEKDGGMHVKMDKDFNPMRSDEAFREWRKKMAGTVQQMGGIQGSGMGGYAWAIDDIVSPKVDWREVLRQFLTPIFGGQRRWLPPSRRSASTGIYLPSRRSEELKIAIAIDTSGSTVGEVVNSFVSEIFGIVGTFGSYEITVIQCDMEIHDVRTYDLQNPFDEGEIELMGGGGTSLVPPFEHIGSHPLEVRALIYMTDGFGDAPDNAPGYPVLWALPEDGVVPAEWGSEVRIPND